VDDVMDDGQPFDQKRIFTDCVYN